jgi:S-formylglutathione hydrolase FrmB
LALSLPETFAAGVSLSGVADVAEFRQARALDYELIFGSSGPERGSEHDLFHLATTLASSGQPRPRLLQCCGTEDFLLAQNRSLRDHLQPLGFDYLYEEGPGLHDWAYWDKMIERTLSWLHIEP